MVKKFLGFILSAALMSSLLTSVALADNETTITMGTTTIEQGTTTASVDISIANNPGIASLGFDIAYDSSFSVAYASGSIFTAAESVFDISKNPMVYSLSSASNKTSNGVLGTFTFTIPENCPAGTYNIKLSDNAVLGGYYNENYDEVPVTLVSGAIIVKAKDTPTPTAKAAVAGKAIEDGFKTFSTDAAIEFAVGATPTIEISKTGKNSDTKLTETLGSGVIGEGKTKIIPIVSYKIDRNGVEAGDIFTIKVTNGTDTSSWTYTVPAE